MYKHNKYNIIDIMINEYDKEGVIKLTYTSMGFLMGMILSGFVYREGASLISRSMKTSVLGLIKTDYALHLENQYLSIVTKL